VPATHGAQLADEDAPVETRKVPAIQLVHAAAPAAANAPAAQARQLPAVVKPVDAEKVPDWHFTQEA
jgi:hypothetical protein